MKNLNYDKLLLILKSGGSLFKKSERRLLSYRLNLFDMHVTHYKIFYA